MYRGTYLPRVVCWRQCFTKDVFKDRRFGQASDLDHSKCTVQEDTTQGRMEFEATPSLDLVVQNERCLDT